MLKINFWFFLEISRWRLDFFFPPSFTSLQLIPPFLFFFPYLISASKYDQYRAFLKEIRTEEEKMKEKRVKRETVWSKIEKEERRKKTPIVEQRLKELHKELEEVEKETIKGTLYNCCIILFTHINNVINE